MHTLPYISRSKGNQTMKFDEYYTRNIFLEKSYAKCDGESNFRPFSKKSKLSISLNLMPEISYSFFFYVQVKETKALATCFYLI